ncbi:MAG: hypothetical protein EG825_06830 [Rhodocyclaceae bacterium]|nr:hypothetical protein [Rhodocyclaceae bacterium]
MNAPLEEILDMAPDTQPRDLISAFELARLTLQREARQGNEEAARAMLRLRLAYLRWAYGASRAAS